ncbi:endonuclease/exonuclease/phosphatase family protein [Roseomonas sp. AR75]|uniref:endonuclease/exonuclease/phosphatase family protein n=1 Tax=Roseomonas sp. AR75 TaxID=2562311 RepID=UPI0010C097D9|nr:endonuclease/exonuclease/phosphatase family protein [Roseomonas sp. AR75]
MTSSTAVPRRGLRSPDRLRVADHLRATSASVRQLLAEFRDARRRSPAPPRAPVEGEMRIASWNLHKCVGTDGRFDPHRSVAVIAELGADVVALQEADRRFGRRVGLLDPKLLEKHAGLVPLPISHLPDGHGWHGNAILVRPGTKARLRRLALPGAEPRGAVVADLELREGPLRVVAAHFGLLPRCRRRQSAAILAALEESEPLPTVLCGDLNEWGIGARCSLQALSDLFGPVATGPASFPTRLPVLPLDRILAWPQPLVSHVAVHDSPLARVASDHLPLTARLHLDTIAETFAGLRAAA